MRHGLICAAVGLALTIGSAQAATDNDKDAQHTGGAAKGAAVGALAMRRAVDMPLRGLPQAPR